MFNENKSEQQPPKIHIREFSSKVCIHSCHVYSICIPKIHVQLKKIQLIPTMHTYNICMCVHIHVCKKTCIIHIFMYVVCMSCMYMYVCMCAHYIIYLYYDSYITEGTHVAPVVQFGLIKVLVPTETATWW